MSLITQPDTLPRLGCVAEVLAGLSGDTARVDLAGPWGAAKALAAWQTTRERGTPMLVVCAGRVEAETVFEDISTFAGPDHCALLPAWEVLPTDAMDPADDIVAERMNTLQRLAAPRGEEPLVVVAPARSVLQRVPRPERLAARTLRLRVGDEYDLDDLLLDLTKLGYERELMVEGRGQISVRGCIFDVFPIEHELPFRVEFFGDEVESIRVFEPETQRSVEQVDHVDLMPRSEKAMLLKEREALASLTDYLAQDTLVVIDEPAAVEEAGRKLTSQAGDSEFLLAWDDAAAQLERFATLRVAQIALASDTGVKVRAPMRSLASWEPPAEDFWQQLDQWLVAGYEVYLYCTNTGERQRLLELLADRGFAAGREAGHIHVGVGRLHAGFASADDGLAALSEREVFGRHYVRRRRRRFEAGAAITDFGDLKSGDYVVHEHHGVGRFLGMRRFDGKDGDFLAIQYAKGDKLYLPVTSIDLIQKFTGGDGALPKVDRIGGATWAKTKARVKKAVRDMTDQLLKLYARRESQEGHAFPPDTPWQNEFEDAFPYDETPDQARAIVDVKRDMEQARPMDRLVCGDVGYGKTEVALRAAFKAVQDGRQVAVLVPTTVLAEQHYMTFSERLADYPMTVDLMCRFRSAKEQKETVARLKTGEVDIVVGTHRIVSKDIDFKNLGLLVIDEEHRFGVAQKEKLKQLRATVDVITMSATPIPRTLNLSMLGVRDMSVINTAPNDRLPVHTCIEHFSEDLVKEAIERELGRQGQVFFVHNRVQTIMPMAQMVRRLAPDARVDIGHGQMREGDLERVMTRFIRGETDVLVCTTIIGSGIDIPNANTIIINAADNFGLSELYQLRGRVGRYKHRAFAYLLVPADKALSEDAQKRLQALEDFSNLGAGFRIAMRDLEIRGCGNILGGEQHGHIAAVGLDTYTQLLQETVAELRGEPVERRMLPQFEVSIDAHIPDAYVPSEAQRMTLYRRIATVSSVEDADEMRAEVADRFGPPPVPVKRLLDIMRVRALAADHGVTRLVAAGSALALEFASARYLGQGTRTRLSQHFGARVQFSFGDTPTITFTHDGGDADSAVRSAQHLLNALRDEEDGDI